MTKIGSFVIVTLLTLFSLAYTAPALGGDAIVSWDANTEPELAGYKLYYGTASRSYGIPIDIGNQTTYTVTGLGPGTYYFAVTAYDTSGNETSFSNEGSKTFADTSPGVLVVSPDIGLSVSGNAGGPFSSSSKSYSLTNTGGTTISYTISKGQSWVSLSEASGSLTQGASTSVTVSINSNANNLTPGAYSDTVSFTNTTNGNGNTSRSASVSVFSPGSAMTITLTPSEDTYLNRNEVKFTLPLLKTYTFPDNMIANAILMKFDLSTIPQGSSIQNATLNLYLVQSDTKIDSNCTISVHKVINKDPDLTKATGYTYDGENSWTANNCCREGIPLAQADIAAAEDNEVVDKTNEYKTWAVTQMVQDWVNTSITNFGVLVNADPSKPADHYRYFASMEDTNTNIRPYLNITYSTAEGTPNAPTGLTLK